MFGLQKPKLKFLCKELYVGEAAGINRKALTKRNTGFESWELREHRETHNEPPTHMQSKDKCRYVWTARVRSMQVYIRQREQDQSNVNRVRVVVQVKGNLTIYILRV